MDTIINIANYNEVLREYLNFISSHSIPDTLDSFCEFLETNNLSTAYANEVYCTLKNTPTLFHKIFSKNDIKLRNKHYTAKKVMSWVAPIGALSVGVGTAGILGAAATTSVVGGEFLGMTMQANPVANALKVSTVAFGVAGLPVGTATVGFTKLSTKVSLNKKYGDPKKAIKKNNLNSLNIDQLLEDISDEKEEILNLKVGKPNLLKKLLKTLKVVDNRAKTYKLEQIHNALIRKAIEINNLDLNDTDKQIQLKPYIENLTKIYDFSSEQFKKSRIYMLLTRDEDFTKRKHRELLENEDILAEMERVEAILYENYTTKKIKRNHKEAEKIVLKMLNKYDEFIAPIVDPSEELEEPVVIYEENTEELNPETTEEVIETTEEEVVVIETEESITEEPSSEEIEESNVEESNSEEIEEPAAEEVVVENEESTTEEPSSEENEPEASATDNLFEGNISAEQISIDEIINAEPEKKKNPRYKISEVTAANAIREDLMNDIEWKIIVESKFGKDVVEQFTNDLYKACFTAKKLKRKHFDKKFYDINPLYASIMNECDALCKAEPIIRSI